MRRERRKEKRREGEKGAGGGGGGGGGRDCQLNSSCSNSLCVCAVKTFHGMLNQLNRWVGYAKISFCHLLSWMALKLQIRKH